MSDVVLLDATTLISLGTVGELDLLTNFDGDLLIPETVAAEVSTEPARTNLDTFLVHKSVTLLHTPDDNETLDAVHDMLETDTINGDVELVAAVLAFVDHSQVGVVSDDRRIRTLTSGLGASITGTIGVVIRAVAAGLEPAEGEDLVRRIDSHGLHMTGELRETAYQLVDDAAETR